MRAASDDACLSLLFQGTIAGYVCLCLLNLRFEWKRINLKQKLVLLNVLAIANVHAHELARHSRLYGHAGICLDVSDCTDFHGKILPRNNRCADCGGRPASGGFRRAGWSLRTRRNKDHG